MKNRFLKFGTRVLKQLKGFYPMSQRKSYKQIFLFFICLLISVSAVLGQSSKKFTKTNRSFYKARYGKNISKPSKKCNTLSKKRTSTPKKKIHLAQGKTAKPKKMAESDATPTTVARVTPKPAPAPKPAPPPPPPPKPAPKKNISNLSIEEKHMVEDDILKNNNIPPPTSEKHEEIRKIVSKQLETIEQDKPIKLEPLYFKFDEDEFSVVDMDPFLVAVEYALQGRIILIEGHTDSRGQDNYNVQLSVKRVQKIRSLMLEMGVSDDRISVVGYGEESSKNDTNSTEAQQLNRRVDFTVY